MKANNTINALVYRVNKLLKQQLQDSLKGYDITTDQWIILDHVYRKSGDYNQKDLAVVCFKEKAAITRMIDIMEKKGLVVRGKSPADRREYLISITEAGKQMYKKTLPIVESTQVFVEGLLTETERKQMTKMMQKLEVGLSEKR